MWLDHSTLQQSGITTQEIRWLREHDELQPIRCGRYVISEDWKRCDEQARHGLRAGEVGHFVGSAAVLSHASAAVLHGLPVTGIDLRRAHLTWSGSPGRRGTTNVHPHRALLLSSEIVATDGGALVTTPARTVYDLARSTTFWQAVAAADAALANQLCDKEELISILRDRTGWPGTARAYRVFDFADGRAESVGESYSRCVMAQIGLPTPELQIGIFGRQQQLLGRVDFDFDQFNTVAEFDGLLKYQRYARPGESAADAVVREKIREDAIRDMGKQVVRLIWADLDFPHKIGGSFQSAFGRAGHTTWTPQYGVPLGRARG